MTKFIENIFEFLGKIFLKNKKKFKNGTYEIIDNGKAIKCLKCGMVSYSLGDIKYLWCNNCKKWHDINF